MATRRPRARADDRGDGKEGRPEGGTESGDTLKVHEAYLEARLRGGAPPSPEAHARALRQFQSLPGAVRATPAPVPPTERRDPAEASEDEPRAGREDRP